MSTVADFPQLGSDAPLPLPPTEDLWQISLDTYHEMIRQGILTEDDPVELWEGVLVWKMPKNRAHTIAMQLTQKALATRITAGWHIAAQEPVTLLRSEPEPDVMIMRGTERDYAEQNPTAKDLALIVEVSDSSLSRDRGFKKSLYAKALVPVYWIVNLIDRQVEVYTEPGKSSNKPDYLKRQVFGIDDSVPLALPGQELLRLPVREVLP